MKTIEPAPRHRMARRPLTDSMVEGVGASGTARSIVSASAAGVALTTIAANVASAAPATPQSKPQSIDLNTTTVVVDDVTTVGVPDIEWTVEENVTVSATAGAPAPTSAVATSAADQFDSATPRSETHSNTIFDTSVRQTTLNATGGDIVPVILGLTDVPYVYGGEALDGPDCSGLVRYAYATADVDLLHSSSAQTAGGTIMSDPQPDDIMFYPSYVATYIDGGRMAKVTVPGRLSQVSSVRPGATYMRYWVHGT